LLDDSPRSATVEAQEEILVARIGRRDFARMLDKEPKVAVALLRTLTARLRASEASAQH
jgi:CRP-like cAMP-binding protein